MPTAKRAADDARLSHVVHYVITHCAPEKLGATKLNKILWYADVFSYRFHGQTITGQEAYEKRQFGPVPKNINSVLRGLESDGKIRERKSLTSVGPRREFVWLEPPAIDQFSGEEIDILRNVMESICEDHSAASISDLTHDALWEETEIGQDMPVKAGAVFSNEITPEAIKWAKDAFDANRTSRDRISD